MAVRTISGVAWTGSWNFSCFLCLFRGWGEPLWQAFLILPPVLEILSPSCLGSGYLGVTCGAASASDAKRTIVEFQIVSPSQSHQQCQFPSTCVPQFPCPPPACFFDKQVFQFQFCNLNIMLPKRISPISNMHAGADHIGEPFPFRKPNLINSFKVWKFFLLNDFSSLFCWPKLGNHG